MKICVIYHNQDIDGWMSAAIVKYFWLNTSEWAGHTLDFIGYTYGQSIPDLSGYDKVIMCDISFPKEYMIKLINKFDNLENFIWVDHHISAMKELNSFVGNGIVYHLEHLEGLRDTNFAACELTWKYFFPNEPMPEIVRLLGRYDCFGHKGTDEETKVLEFQYWARTKISNYEEAYDYLNIIHFDNRYNSKELIENCLLLGHSIYEYLCTEVKQSYKNGFQILLEEPGALKDGLAYVARFICVNKERFNPINFGINYHMDKIDPNTGSGYDGAACFHYVNGKWYFSLYNDNGLVDCSIIAKQYGGGGHKGAAGFIIDNIDSLKELLAVK